MSANAKKIPQAHERSGDIPEWAMSAVGAIMASLKSVDTVTYSHCLRVGVYSSQLAKSLGLNEFEQRLAEFSGMLHDIGKMGVDQGIIHKPGKLTHEEMERMMNHPVLSENIIKPLATHRFFEQVLPAVRHHHERLDGDGYPDRLAGEDIPLLSRIILVVDTLDAMGQDRAYRKGLPLEVIYKEIQRCSGSQFDNSVAKIFLESHRFWGAQLIDLETMEKNLKKAA